LGQTTSSDHDRSAAAGAQLVGIERQSGTVNGLLVGKLTLLLALSNGTPVFAAKLFGPHLAYPVDSGAPWFDGRPLFGSSKTFRGILLSVLATSAGAALIGFAWQVGAVVAGLAMAGDLLSSFVKRRIGLPAGSRATGLDQIPESLIPLLGSARALSLTVGDIAAVVAIFFVGEVFLSRILYRLHVRDHPY
jgi:CDP-2,3-bis-(O-geranylgeranyl)-sn-glycerol synthase